MIGSRKTERDFFQSRDWLGRIQQTDCGGSTSQPPWEPCVPNIGESDDANPPPFPAIASDPISQPIQRQQLISIHACFAAMRAWQKTPKMGISGSVVHRDCGFVPEPKSPDLVTEIPHQPCPQWQQAVTILLPGSMDRTQRTSVCFRITRENTAKQPLTGDEQKT